MITLNEVTQKMDGTNFDTYRTADLIDSLDSDISKKDQEGLKDRLQHLDKEFEAGNIFDLFSGDGDELGKLRSMFG